MITIFHYLVHLVREDWKKNRKFNLQLLGSCFSIFLFLYGLALSNIDGANILNVDVSKNSFFHGIILQILAIVCFAFIVAGYDLFRDFSLKYSEWKKERVIDVE